MAPSLQIHQKQPSSFRTPLKSFFRVVIVLTLLFLLRVRLSTCSCTYFSCLYSYSYLYVGVRAWVFACVRREIPFTITVTYVSKAFRPIASEMRISLIRSQMLEMLKYFVLRTL